MHHPLFYISIGVCNMCFCLRGCPVASVSISRKSCSIYFRFLWDSSPVRVPVFHIHSPIPVQLSCFVSDGWVSGEGKNLRWQLWKVLLYSSLQDCLSNLRKNGPVKHTQNAHSILTAMPTWVSRLPSWFSVYS